MSTHEGHLPAGAAAGGPLGFGPASGAVAAHAHSPAAPRCSSAMHTRLLCSHAAPAINPHLMANMAQLLRSDM